MTVEVVSVLCGGNGPQQSWHADGDPKIYLDDAYDNEDNKISPCAAYQYLFDWPVKNGNQRPDVLVYLHDDVTIHDSNWLNRITHLFNNSACVCVGFGGATQLGHDDLYKVGYRLPYMARQGYVSNQTDWQTHGGHFEEDKQVVVVDAFCMAVRTDFLRRVGGWPVGHLTHHCLDLWLACEAARAGKQVWMAGVSCTHHGGGSSTKPAYQRAKWLQGGSLEEDHRRPHKWLFDNYRDVLPIRVKHG